ncbi:hypothetical protein BH18ACI2_BH18ACI2_25530 [soil metagenome]|jgi:uncharacterized protein (DUF433 family)
MTSLETTQAVPLTIWEDGSIRLAGSRVTLDSIVYQFNLGATAEQITDSFPPLALADIYAVIAYYLTHRAEVEEYLLRRESEGDAMQTHLESDSQYQNTKTEMRERLLARWRAR